MTRNHMIALLNYKGRGLVLYTAVQSCIVLVSGQLLKVHVHTYYPYILLCLVMYT